MDVGKRIKYSREKKGVTLQKIADYIGVTEATVQRYESGNIKNLKLDVLTKIAEVLKINPGYLMGWTDVMEDTSSDNEYTFYPTSVSAGHIETAEPIADYQIQKITLPDALMGKWAGHKDLKIMRINGESMNKEIPNGSLIVVKPVEIGSLKNGDVIVFNKDYEYAAKIFFNDIENKRVIFKPNSTDESFTDFVVAYEDADNLSIIGKIVLVILEKD